MRHNAVVLLLFLVFFRLSSVKAYKAIDDNLQEEEDPEWNQVIGNFTNFWPRSYIFQVTSTFSKFYLDSSISFSFSFSISLFFLDFHFPFPFLLLFGLLHILTMAIVDTYRNHGSNPIMITNVSATPIFFSDYSPEDLVKYGSGFRSLWNTNPYLDLDKRSKRVHGGLRFHRRKY